MFLNFEKYLIDKIPNEPIFIEVGANKGQWFTEIIKIYPNCKIHAFEPIVGITPNINNVIINNCAVDISESSDRIFYITKDDTTSSLLKLDKEVTDNFVDFIDGKGVEHKKSDFNITKQTRVNTIRLDSYIEKNNISEIHYLKIDAEGNDLNVFRSLGQFTSKVIACEVEVWNNPKTLFQKASWIQECSIFMETNNFQLVEKYIHGRGLSSDLLFINTDKVKKGIAKL